MPVFGSHWFGEGFDTWDYDAMGSSKWNLNGTWGTNTSSVLAQGGVGYNVFVQAISKTSFNALNASWSLTWSFNKTGYNSWPYPGQLLGITQSDDPATAGTTLIATPGDLLLSIYAGNAYSLQLHIYDTSGTEIHSTSLSDSTYAQAGFPNLLTFDWAAGEFVWKSSTSTSTDDLVTHATFTMTSAERTAMLTPTNRLKEYYIGGSCRGGTDGFRNIEWAST